MEPHFDVELSIAGKPAHQKVGESVPGEIRCVVRFDHRDNRRHR